MRIATLTLLALSIPSFAGDMIEVFGHKWRVPVAKDWVNDGGVLKLVVPRPQEQPRRPIQFALAQTEPFRRVTVEAEARKEHFDARRRRTSLIIVYAWQDDAHFNYAHLSVDTGTRQPVHNGIFHVFGGERVRISPLDGAATLDGEDWHKVRLDWDGSTGRVVVHVNGKTSPAMEAVDMSLREGRVGIGSFFDLGEFRNVRIIPGSAN
jgi:hypothetical protein